MITFRHDVFEIPVAYPEKRLATIHYLDRASQGFGKVRCQEKPWVQVRSLKEIQCLDEKRKDPRTEFWGTSVLKEQLKKNEPRAEIEKSAAQEQEENQGSSFMKLSKR